MTKQEEKIRSILELAKMLPAGGTQTIAGFGEDGTFEAVISKGDDGFEDFAMVDILKDGKMISCMEYAEEIGPDLESALNELWTDCLPF